MPELSEDKGAETLTGMPELVLIPAPVMTTIFFAFHK